MSEFVRKTMVGYKEVPEGSFDSECTHVILTKREYDKYQHDLFIAQQNARDTEDNADREIQRAQDAAQREIETIKVSSAQRVAAIEKELVAERQESALQRGLNANLIRIAKERANADRKLKPKKKHTGYVVVASTEKEHRYKDGNRRWCSVILWETVLETPYVVDFEVAEVRNLIQELFQDQEDGKWLIRRIGITADYEDGYADMIQDREWRTDYHQYNVMLERRLKANYRTGFWEIIFYHTKPLNSVPMDMRAKQ